MQERCVRLDLDLSDYFTVEDAAKAYGMPIEAFVRVLVLREAHRVERGGALQEPLLAYGRSVRRLRRARRGA